MPLEAVEQAGEQRHWRVLLVEDDEPVRRRLARILEDWDEGSLVAACGTLADALGIIDREGIDLLVTDLRLPDGSGIDAIHRLKAVSSDAEAMVISVLADERSVIDAIEAGAAGYLHKDAYAIDLLEAINDLLAGHSPISSSIARLLVRRLAGTEIPSSAPDVPSNLTAREMDILNQIARGLTYDEIASRLEISRNTVPVHIRNIYRKLSVNNRSQAVFEARERGNPAKIGMARIAKTLGRSAGLIALLLLAVLPLVVHLPEPHGLTIDRASFALDGAPPEEVSLPHSWPRDISAGLHAGEYRLSFTLHDAQELAGTQFLLIPLTRLTPQIQLNGQDLFVVRTHPWAAPLFEMPHLARLPEDGLQLGPNVLTIRMTREGGFRIGFLAPAYLGTADQILPTYRLLTFLVDVQRIGVLALFALLTLGVAGLWLARRSDGVYGWFCLTGTGLMLANLAALNPFDVLRGGFSSILVVSLGSFTSMVLFGLARTMIGRDTPRWLIPFALLWSGLALLGLLAYPHYRPVGAVLGLVSIGWLLAAVVVLAREFLATRNAEHALVMMGIVALIGYGFVDIASIAGLHDRGALLLLYPQILLVTALAVILFRRLTQSLDTLDGANETLRLRLHEQQEELAQAHAHETLLSANIAREQERQRLTRDLHDGLSGHIVSIIAQAEHAQSPDIEKTAREALDDLRLVIQSLDIGDEDIPVVLAYFRERVSLQLRRLNIAMEWSMDRLPAITGVTPGHALALLRILQEAVTNAIKHGPARRIAFTGERAQDGSTRIIIENDGRNDLPHTLGKGLGNMRQRAASLGGEVRLEPLPTGMRLTLNLSTSLPTSTVWTTHHNWN